MSDYNLPPTERSGVRGVTLLDALRCSVMNKPDMANQACTIDRLAGEKPSRLLLNILRRRLGAFSGELLTHRDGGHMQALACAKQRSTPKCWEITHLLMRPAAHESASELLDALSHTAAQSGCQRLLLRLDDANPLVDTARRSGYFPRISETLFRCSPIPTPDGAPAPMRPRTSSDDHALFRLYNASTPADVRTHLGMTLDQWAAWHGISSRGCAEFILESEGIVCGWLRLRHMYGVWLLDLDAHPDYESQVPSMLNFALGKMRPASPALCIAPAYALALRRALAHRNFRETGEYITLIKNMPISVAERAQLRMTATSV